MYTTYIKNKVMSTYIYIYIHINIYTDKVLSDIVLETKYKQDNPKINIHNLGSIY